ncbi:MAG: DnaD domain protein [Defluviitaleaceae bacterium]|nr:DnaD domain protein [Defluviitaleaceae bacterium]MCL2262473.1 DnaD domain protein [Defluviitaleaceae bacterium]
MCAINMKLGYKRSTMEVPFVFIDDYFTDCLPVYPLIYIWSLRRLLDGSSASLQEIGERFQLTEGDVIKAWRHWENEKLVTIASNKDAMEITFLPIEPKHAQDAPPLTLLTVSAPESTPTPYVSGFAQVRPEYTPPELECYSNESMDVARIFKSAERVLGMINHSIMQTVFSFHDWLRLPFEVIEYLLEYCAENDHRNLRYIEKCAIDWADNGITDIEKALLYVQKFNSNYQTILQHMGQVSAYPTKVQRKFMDKWLHEWHMPLELITEACDRCVLKINKFDKKYTEGILKKWHDNGIQTLEAAAAADEAFAQDSTKIANRTPAAKAKPNRFINFNQREIDFDKYEKLERAYLEQKLGDG